MENVPVVNKNFAIYIQNGLGQIYSHAKKTSHSISIPDIEKIYEALIIVQKFEVPGDNGDIYISVINPPASPKTEINFQWDEGYLTVRRHVGSRTGNAQIIGEADYMEQQTLLNQIKIVLNIEE